MSSAYLLEEISFSYDAAPVLMIDRFEIARGEIAALVGPNGSGKTTLLKQLAFVERPGRGTISFFGERSTPANLIAFRRRVGFLLQHPYLFHTSVLSNITWGLRIRGITGRKASRMALEALERVGLSGFEHRRAVSLSGGESQRVALARALVIDPEVLLLDEPANNLDTESLRRTEEVVSVLNREYGRTVVFTTHNLSTWANLAHRIVNLHQGSVVSGQSENVFNGELHHDGTVFDTGRVTFRLASSQVQGSRITIDPERISLSKTRPAQSCSNMFEGRIVALSENGNRIRVEVHAGEKFRVLVDPAAWDNLRPGFGENVWLIVDEGALTILP